MNLPAPHLSPNSSGYAKPVERTTAPGAQSFAAVDGGFADVIADLAQRGETPVSPSGNRSADSSHRAARAKDSSSLKQKLQTSLNRETPAKKSTEEVPANPDGSFTQQNPLVGTSREGEASGESGEVFSQSEEGESPSIEAGLGVEEFPEAQAFGPGEELAATDGNADQMLSGTPATSVSEDAIENFQSALTEAGTVLSDAVPTPNGILVARTNAPLAANLKPVPTENSGTADFAELEKTSGDPESQLAGSVEKNFLTTDNKELALGIESLGTDVAISTPEMFSTATLPNFANVFSKNTAPVLDVQASTDGSAQNFSHVENFGSGEAHKAVQAAIDIGERFTVAGQRAVNLQFTVRGENLFVHVEMLGGEVRTTFRTASAELRIALAHEWQAQAAANVDRAQRFSDPVFSAEEPAHSSGGSGGSERDARGSDAQQAPEKFVLSSRFAAARSSGAPVASAGQPHPAAPLTSLRLHTFA